MEKKAPRSGIAEQRTREKGNSMIKHETRNRIKLSLLANEETIYIHISRNYLEG